MEEEKQTLTKGRDEKKEKETLNDPTNPDPTKGHKYRTDVEEENDEEKEIHDPKPSSEMKAKVENIINQAKQSGNVMDCIPTLLEIEKKIKT